MDLVIPDFDFAYDAGDIHYGRHCVADLAALLDDHGYDRGLVVCGSTVGSTAAVIDPVTDGLGDRLAGVFDETDPSKYVGIARDGVDVVRETGADVLVSLGGGSSLDLAKATAILEASDRSYEETVSFIESEGYLPVPDDELLPIVCIPTTMAGADLSTGGSVTLGPDFEGAPEDAHRAGGFTDPRLMPRALLYDPELFATTPPDILASSAMNGFDKGIEMLYSRNATSITDATAMHGLRHLRRGLPALREATAADAALDESIIGIILVQYGLSTPGSKKLSVIHAFGHGLARHYDVQQGSVHAIMAPHALRFVFDRVDARRGLLAEAFGVDAATAADRAAGVVEAVTAVRDGLELPTQLRDIPDLDRADLSAVAHATLTDPIMANGPPDFEPSQADIEAVLDDAW